MFRARTYLNLLVLYAMASTDSESATSAPVATFMMLVFSLCRYAYFLEITHLRALARVPCDCELFS